MDFSAVSQKEMAIQGSSGTETDSHLLLEFFYFQKPVSFLCWSEYHLVRSAHRYHHFSEGVLLMNC
jgi:hypothetical protein